MGGERSSPSGPGTDYLVCFHHNSAPRSFAGMLTAKRSPVVHPLKGCEGTATERGTVGSHNE